MKRMVSIAIALTLAAGFALAQTTSVTSENTVGYQNVENVGGTVNMIAVNWDAISGGDMPVQELFADPLGAGLTGGTGPTVSDQLNVWNPTTSGYTIYWLYDSNDAFPSWDGKWIDTAFNITADTFSKGAAFWLRTRGSTVTNSILGQVPTNAIVNHTLAAGTVTMVGSAFPADLPLNDGVDVLAAGATGGTGPTVSDQINVWNPATSGYTIYWLYDSNDAFPTWDGKWIDTGFNITGYSLPMGQGAWYRSRGATDVTWAESKPY